MGAWTRQMIAAAATVLFGLGGVSAATELQLDPGFGTNGIVSIAFGSGNADTPRDLLIQPDGKILTVGTSSASGGYIYIAISRHHADGTPDAAGFGVGGQVLQRFNFRDYANAIDLAPDGKIVAAGMRMTSTGVSTQAATAYRFHGDGTVDTTFGNHGFVEEWSGYLTGEYAGVKALPGGNVLAGGRRSHGYFGGVTAFAMRRYQADGTRTLSGGDEFGINGFGSCAFPDDGGMLLAYHAELNGRREFVIARLDSSANPVAGFDGGGILQTGIAAVFQTGLKVIALPDGRILLAGTTPRDGGGTQWTVLRFLADGSPDTSFNGAGGTHVHFAGVGSQETLYDAAVDDDGRIVLVGRTGLASGESGLARLTADGAPDSTFSDDGLAALDLSPYTGTHYLTQVRILADGGILAAGYDFMSNNGDFFLAKFRAPDVAAVGDEGERTHRLSALAYPNPSSGGMNIRFDLWHEHAVQVEVFDVAGRLVRRLFEGRLSAGAHSLHWDGLDQGGRSAAAGVYYARITGAGAMEAMRLVLVR